MFFCFLGKNVVGQKIDSTLTLNQFIDLVRNYHPVARLAEIGIQRAGAEKTRAQAGFDPRLSNLSSQKVFDGTDYYALNRPALEIPTWYGITVRGGMEYLSGDKPLPTDSKGESSYLGIEVPLAKNLLMDRRRAALMTAKINIGASEVEKRSLLNALLGEAIYEYWNWVKAYNNNQIFNNAVLVNGKRLQLIRTAVENGERPGMDTIEALAQYRQLTLLQTQYYWQFRNQTVELSGFLWTKETQPVSVPDFIRPDFSALALSGYQDSILPAINELIQQASDNHPDLLRFSFRNRTLEVEKKLSFQELLPGINFKYNYLNTGYNVLNKRAWGFFDNDFQYTLSVSIPLRFSEGRGAYRVAKLKIQENTLKWDQKRLSVVNKVKMQHNQVLNTLDQIKLTETITKNYLQLFQAEELRFYNGESSLFLVNARELRFIESNQKLMELKVSFQQALNYLKEAAGILN